MIVTGRAFTEESLKDTHRHMLQLALGALAHANWHANYFSPENDYWSELSVLQAAHAAEILIKARIAQKHPLLIFEQLPKAAPDGAALSLRTIFESGRTYQFTELPDRLWATTGIRLQSPERYRAFGKLRNCIQHFTAPDGVDASEASIRFIYEVIDPFIHQCWGLHAIDYNEDYEPYVYLVAGLIRRGIPFLVSPRMMESFGQIDLDWPKGKRAYRKEMAGRFEAARLKLDQPNS